MKTRPILTLAALWALCTLLSSCRENISNGGFENPFLTEPEILVPLGTLKSPRGIVADTSGDFWVADTENDLIRRFSSNGIQLSVVQGFTRPTYMGYDRSTRDILVISGLNIIRINPLNNNATIVAGLGAGLVDTTAVFDVNTGQTRSRPLVAQGAGDVSGAPNGDIFVSAVAHTGEHYIVRVRSGQMTALAFSAHVPSNQTAGPMFLSVDRFGTLFTGFFTSANQTSPRIFLVEPGSLFLSQPVSGSLLSTGARGSSIDDAGILFIADAGNQELIIFNTFTNRVEDIVTIGPIQGIAQPAPRDVAVSPDGSVLVTVSDLFATPDNPGVVLKYGRRLRTQ
jgi:hypothetical protein